MRLAGNLIGFYIEDKWIVLDGGTAEDGTFVNCKISIEKEPARMKNVKFINCEFDLPQSTTAERFLMALFKDSAVTLNAG